MDIDKIRVKVGFKRVFPLKIEQFSRPESIKEELWKNETLIDVSKKHKTGRQIHIIQK